MLLIGLTRAAAQEEHTSLVNYAEADFVRQLIDFLRRLVGYFFVLAECLLIVSFLALPMFLRYGLL